MGLKIYKKKLNYSYTFGIFPTIELLKTKPKTVETVLLSSKSVDSKGVDEIVKLCEQHDINYDISDKAINKLAIKDKTLAIGVFEKYESNLKKGVKHLALVNPSLPGNVGTIIRTMVGFGIKNLAIIKPAVDVFDPKVVRASMGAVFKINFEYFENFANYKNKYNENTIYPFILKGKKVLNEVIFDKKATLVFGNEGSGLSNEFEKYENTVKIEHSPEIESLNLASAVSVSLFELYK